jgi:MOSC domain-containing protein YiiM
MKVLSVNVGLPRIVEYNGRPVATSIFKTPVSGRIKVGETNLDGDRQADLRVHGGYYKAVYAYPSEHYEYWRNEFPEMELSYGIFGENLTTEGILESEVRPGDELKVGTAEFTVTQPRSPCSKLGIRFARADIIRRFAKSGRSGFYLAIKKTGELEVGNEIELFGSGDSNLTIDMVFREKMKL